MKKLILTVDDGPSETIEDKLVFLNEHNIYASFFCLGSLLLKREEVSIDILEQGHDIYNHGFDHTDATIQTKKEFIHSVLSTQKIIDEIYKKANRSSMKVYRFPYGRFHQEHVDAISSMGFTNPFRSNSSHVLWDIDMKDYKSDRLCALRVEDVSLQSENHRILLMHDTKDFFLFKKLILMLKEKGFSFKGLMDA